MLFLRLNFAHILLYIQNAPRMTKKILLLSLFSLCAYLVNAQSWVENKQKIDALISDNKITKAAQELFEIEKSALGFSLEDQLDFHTFAADILYDNSKLFLFSIKHLEKAVKLTEILFPDDKQKQLAIEIKWVIGIRDTDNPKFVTDWYHNNIHNLEAKYGKTSTEMARIYSILAPRFAENGNFEIAFSLINESLAIISEHKTAQEGQILNRAGLVYYCYGNLEKAFFYYEKSVAKIREQYGENDKRLAQAYSMLGEAYNSVENGDLGLENTLKALEIVEKTSPKSEDLHYYYNAVGVSYRLKKDNVNAELYLKKGAKLGLHYSWISLARVYRAQGKLEEAHQALDSCYQLMSYNEPLNFKTLKKTTSFSSVLTTRSDVFKDEYLKTNDLQFLVKSEAVLYENNQLALYIIESFHQDFNKKTAYAQVTKYNNQAIDRCYELFEKTQNKQYLEKLFRYSEVNKSLLLLETILTNKKLQISDIPYEITQKEAFLKEKITQLEKNAFENKDNNETKHQLFEYRESYNQVKDSVSFFCKDYYKNDYAIAETDLKTVQKMLDASSSFVEYSLTKDFLYTIVVNQNQLEVKRAKMDFPLSDLVKKLTQKATKIDENNYAEDAAELCKTSFELYNKLLLPVADFLKPKLIIVPNGILDYLPFELLLTMPAIAPERFHLHDFLIKKHSVSYQYSANLWRELSNEKTQKASKNLLAVAPFFEKSAWFSDSLNTLADASRVSFSALPFSGEEVFRIAKTMKGKVLISNEANKETLKTTMGDYRFLHFATHGKANTEKGEFSYLALKNNDNALKIGLLYVKEIYNILIKAEMVVLSACETGIGEAQKGEGLISLARAFTYSGAQSVLTTLWAVNDEKTKDLMIYFYENLKKNKSKDEALQQAKLKYIEKNKNAKAHPYYWASFKLLGNSKAVAN